MPLILGLETSCDETAAAVVEDGGLVRSNVVASQHELHEMYAGVVPEIASRAHLERIAPVVHGALRRAGVALEDLDAIAVGNRPGLVGSLLVGVSAAKTIAWSLGKPLIGVDHIRAHLYAAALEDERREHHEISSGLSPLVSLPSLLLYPALGLVVSGGHTSLYEVTSPLEMRLMGKTIDDAVGEAYDKAATILRLGYPGGPSVDRAAQRGDPRKFDMPRSLLGPDSLDFSFSGMKTALLYKVRGVPTGRGASSAFERSVEDLNEAERIDLAAAFQHAVVGTVITKLGRALDRLAAEGRPVRSLVIGGGVSANSLLRARAIELGEKRGISVHLPRMAYCVDNAAMIAGLAFHQWRAGAVDDLHLPVIATTGV